MARWAARWVTAQEKRAHDEHNGVVINTRDGARLCFVSPMAMAERVAAALNLADRYTNDELQRLSNALHS